MVTPFTDLREGDAENLIFIYLVLPGLIARPAHSASFSTNNNLSGDAVN
jgi:hypothetical protein